MTAPPRSPRRLAAASVVAALAASSCGHASGQVIRLIPDGVYGGDYGHRVLSIDDVDGDGWPDFVVAAPYHSAPVDGVIYSGRYHVFSGATGEWLYFRVGPQPSMGGTGLISFSIGIAAVPDFVGDGLAKVAVGSGNHRIYLSDVATNELLTVLEPSCPGFFGREISPIPGLASGGTPSILAGCTGATTSSAHVFDAATGLLLHQVFNPVEGIHNGGFSSAVAGLGDIDGDGVGDFAVGNEDEPTPPAGSGRVHLFSGATGAYLRPISSPAGVPAHFGWSLAPVPDADGDGFADLLIAAPFQIPPGDTVPRGVAYLYSGATGSLLHTLSVSPDHVIAAYFGWSLAAAPDLDGDGRPELVVGAPFESGPNHEYAGLAYVFSGGTGELLRTLPSRSGRRANGQFGHSVGASGPVSASTRGVVLVGDRYEQYLLPNTNTGGAYAFLFCRADTDADGRINSGDISRFLIGWIGTLGTPPGTLPPPGVHHGDFNADGQVNSADISEFLAQWLQGVSAGGCL